MGGGIVVMSWLVVCRVVCLIAVVCIVRFAASHGFRGCVVYAVIRVCVFVFVCTC